MAMRSEIQDDDLRHRTAHTCQMLSECRAPECVSVQALARDRADLIAALRLSAERTCVGTSLGGCYFGPCDSPRAERMCFACAARTLLASLDGKG